jgi:hypothetical protein
VLRPFIVEAANSAAIPFTTPAVRDKIRCGSMSGNRRASQHSSRPSLHQHRRHSIDFSRWHFDIDAKLNRFLPRPPWHHLPRPVSHFFGYRGDEQPKTVGNLVIAYWSLIGAFCGVLLISEVSLHIPEFRNHHAPIIVGSFVRTTHPWILVPTY